MIRLEDIRFDSIDLTQQITGDNQLFILTEPVGVNRVLLYNGTRIRDADYAVNGTDLITNFIPEVNSTLKLDFISYDGETSTGIEIIDMIEIKSYDMSPQINGVTKNFIINQDITKSYYKLYYNGVAKIYDKDYTIEGSLLKTNFEKAPFEGETLFIEYINIHTSIFGDDGLILPGLEDRISVKMMLTVDEIIEQIREYYPDGIAKVDKNGLTQVYLVSQTKGADAFINVDGLAAPIIFGPDIKTANGEDMKKGEIDYGPLYDELKSRMGVPIAPFELTEDMIKSGLRETLNLYYKWRNFKTRQISVQLKGDPENGYEIPPIVPNQKAIKDILFRPRIPFSVFGGHGFESFVWNQMYFNQYNSTRLLTSGFIADYSIMNMASQDWGNILGTHPRWQILNDRIFVTPKLPEYSRVVILFDGLMDMEEIMLDSFVLKYLTAYCKKLVGYIRDQFGGTLQAGETSLQMNGKDLMQQGEDEMQKALEEIKKEAEPPIMVWG